ncbi:MAG TPA: hypothetical protein VKU41_02390 [Polyangiaceae bacterium]|nr:hypothetical protein [Polyangiaceae bacterium]
MRLAPDLVVAARQLTAILSLRLLPFVAYAMSSRSTQPRRKVAAAAGYAAIAALAHTLGASRTLAFIALGSTYYFALCVGLDGPARWLRTGRITRGALLVALFVAFLLIPGVLFPGIAALAFLSFGWEVALSSYSYCIDTSRTRAATATLGDRLFFLLVDPTLVFTSRGKRSAIDPGRGGLGRAAAGTAVVFLGLAVLTPAATQLRLRGSLSSTAAVAVVTIATCGLAQLVALYAAHSGLASVQIGLMKHLGWSVPERYRYPLFASSPMDFWRRWNTYVRVWLEAYVFLPMARRAARTSTPVVGHAVAVIATLVASGLIHDAVVFAGYQAWVGSRTALFLASGGLLVAWRLAGAGRQAVCRRWPALRRVEIEVAVRSLSRVALAGAVVGAAFVWGRS